MTSLAITVDAQERSRKRSRANIVAEDMMIASDTAGIKLFVRNNSKDG